MDEWDPPFRGGHLSTLALAQYFNTFIRHADIVKMANYTLLTSILERDPKTDTPYKSPKFYTFKMFSTLCRGEALRTTVKCGTFATSDYYNKIPYLDVSSVYDPSTKKVIINVVNRAKDQDIATDLQSTSGAFTGSASVTKVTSEDVSNKPYEYDARAQYEPKTESITPSGSTIHYVFPAHSFTQIVANVEHS